MIEKVNSYDRHQEIDIAGDALRLTMYRKPFVSILSIRELPVLDFLSHVASVGDCARPT
jgi:hypothetical protein